jgi:drug/metabolite transporter (DMT)-like permease
MKNLKILSKTTLPALFVIIAAILWGLDGVVLTPRLFNLNVAFVVLMLHLIPFLIMNLFLYNNYKYLFKFNKEDYFYFFLISLFGGALGTLAIVKALFLVNFQSLSVIVLLQKLQPIFAIILASILLKERIKKNFAVWASIAIIAGYFLTFGLSLPNFNTGANTLQAAIYALIAAASFGSATVFGKKVLKKYNFHVATFYRFFFTTIIMTIYVVLTKKIQFLEITKMNWIIFLIIAVTTGSGAIFLYYYGLKKIKAITSTICELFFPISAIVFDYLINKSILAPIQWIAAIIMIIAILKVSIKK